MIKEAAPKIWYFAPLACASAVFFPAEQHQLPARFRRLFFKAVPNALKVADELFVNEV